MLGRTALAEFNPAIGLGKQGVVGAHADVIAWPELGAALTHDDVAADHSFAAELLQAQSLGF